MSPSISNRSCCLVIRRTFCSNVFSVLLKLCTNGAPHVLLLPYAPTTASCNVCPRLSLVLVALCRLLVSSVSAASFGILLPPPALCLGMPIVCVNSGVGVLSVAGCLRNATMRSLLVRRTCPCPSLWLTVCALSPSLSMVTGRQVMAGGLSTEAHASPVPSFCSCCCQSVVPSTDHILWCCPKFHSIRRYPRPADELEARLGWGVNGPKQHLIQQMGQIRAACIEEYIRLGVRRAGGGGGAGGPRS